MRLEPTPWPPRLFLTDAGLTALRAMMADGRFANPKIFAHVRRELGIDPDPNRGQNLAAGFSEMLHAVDGSGAAAFPPLPEWDSNPVLTGRSAPMARRSKTDTLPIPGRRGRKPEIVAASSPAIASLAKDDDTAAAVAVVASAGSSTPARGRRGRTPGPKASAVEPVLLLAADTERVADKASPPADGFEPTGDEGDAFMAEVAILVGSEPGGNTDFAEYEDAALRAEGAMPALRPLDTSTPAAPAAQQDGPNQVMAKLLLAARAEGAQSRWPL